MHLYLDAFIDLHEGAFGYLDILFDLFLFGRSIGAVDSVLKL